MAGVNIGDRKNFTFLSEPFYMMGLMKQLVDF